MEFFRLEGTSKTISFQASYHRGGQVDRTLRAVSSFLFFSFLPSSSPCSMPGFLAQCSSFSSFKPFTTGHWPIPRSSRFWTSKDFWRARAPSSSESMLGDWGFKNVRIQMAAELSSGKAWIRGICTKKHRGFKDFQGSGLLCFPSRQEIQYSTLFFHGNVTKHIGKKGI